MLVNWRILKSGKMRKKNNEKEKLVIELTEYEIKRLEYLTDSIINDDKDIEDSIRIIIENVGGEN